MAKNKGKFLPIKNPITKQKQQVRSKQNVEVKEPVIFVPVELIEPEKQIAILESEEEQQPRTKKNFVASLKKSQEVAEAFEELGPKKSKGSKFKTEEKDDEFVFLDPNIFLNNNTTYNIPTIYDGVPGNQLQGKRKTNFNRPILATPNIVSGQFRIEEIQDKFRRDGEFYWISVLEGAKLKNRLEDPLNRPYIYLGGSSTPEGNYNRNNLFIAANQDFEAFKEVPATTGRNRTSFPLFSEENFKNYFEELKKELENKTFFDIVFDTSSPLKGKEIEENNFLNNSLNLKVNSVYNFYSEEYELESGRLTSEKLELELPNLYSLLQEEVDKPVNPIYQTLFINNLVVRTSEEVALESFKRKFGNILFTSNNTDYLKDVYSFRTQFPMYVQFEMSTTNNVEFVELFRENNLIEPLMKSLIEGPGSKFVNIGGQEIEIPERPYAPLSRDYWEVFKKPEEQIPEQSEMSRTTLFFELWYNNYKNIIQTDDFLKDLDDITFYPKYDSEQTTVEPFEQLKLSIFEDNFSKLLKTYERNFSQIISGVPCYSEDFGYKIKKFRQGIEEPLQTYYFVNSRNSDLIEWADTQVKYEEEYRYEFSIIKFVLGSKYSYENFSYDQNRSAFNVDVVVKPFPSFVEIPVEMCPAQLLDTAPTPPNITFDQYKGVSNTVIVSMNSGIGEYTAKPIALKREDTTKLFSYYRNREQKLFSDITFSNDDPVSFFEIYRTTSKPNSYLDFQNSLHRILNTREKTVLIDNIVPNTKYYYTARSLDIHNNFSNPTSVFQIEMVQNSGVSYLLVDLLKLAPEQIPSRPSKPIKRFIKITPDFGQIILNEKNTNFVNENTAKGTKPVIGVKEDSLFGKTIKLRVISKHTGKILDINLDFVQKHIELKE